MKKFVLTFSQILIIFILGYGQNSSTDTIRLFYLGGQSNMDGYGNNTELPKSLDKTFDNIWIFHGNQVGDDEMNGGLGIWSQLKPGHGDGFSSNGSEGYIDLGKAFADAVYELNK